MTAVTAALMVMTTTASTSTAQPPTPTTTRISAATPTVATPTQTAWRWPLHPRPRVVRLFDLSSGTYAAGHRGIDLGTTPGTPVLAVATGRVTHAGRINGRGTVSVLHADGIRSTYEPVEPRVTRDQMIAAGTPLGTIAEAPLHCGDVACLHLGARRGKVYIDPLALLGAAGVRLLPVP